MTARRERPYDPAAAGSRRARSTPTSAMRLARCETNAAAALLASGRLIEARDCCDRAIAIREELLKARSREEELCPGLGREPVAVGEREDDDRRPGRRGRDCCAGPRRCMRAIRPRQRAGDLPRLLPRCAGGPGRQGRLRHRGRGRCLRTPSRRFPSCSRSTRPAIATPTSSASSPASTRFARATTSAT